MIPGRTDDEEVQQMDFQCFVEPRVRAPQDCNFRAVPSRAVDRASESLEGIEIIISAAKWTVLACSSVKVRLLQS